MTKLVRKFFGVNLTIMRLLGFYPPNKYRRIYKLYTFAVYFFFTTLIPVLCSLYLILDPEINLDKVANNAFIICQLGCFIIKMLPFILRDREIKKSIYMMELPVFIVHAQGQEHLMEDCRKVCKRITWFFLDFCIACVIGWGSTPFVEKSFKLPIDIWLPYDASSGFVVYVISFLYVVAGAANGAVSNGVIDPMIAGLAYYATTQIRILKNNLQHLDKYLGEGLGNGNNQIKNTEKFKHKIIYDRIKQCIVHHKAILNFVKNYEKVYSSVVFTQFSASVLVICICCFTLSRVEVFSLTFGWMLTFLVTMLSEIFLYCYFGTVLLEENNTITDSLYMGNWYDYDLRCKKALIILSERSKRPMLVTAGKILNLSLETFTTILRRAYSLLAVLKNY